MRTHTIAAALLLSLPTALLAQRGPTGLTVTGTAASATITWSPVAGGVSYSVKRWKQDDPRCCNNASASLGKPTWTDVGATNEGFSQAGVYVFEVTVVMDDRTTAASVVNWTRPDTAPAPVITRDAIAVKTLQTVNLPAPGGVTVRNDLTALVFSWQPVSGATGYQIDASAAPTGPWTSLVTTPVATTQFAYTPAPGVLNYYRIAPAVSLAASVNSTIVPFMYGLPINPLGVSAAQSRADVTVSWNPVPGAIGYEVIPSGNALPYGGALPPVPGLTVGGSMTSATFTSLVSGEAFLIFHVIAHFPPQGAPGAVFSTRTFGLGGLVVYTPSICWPAAGVLPPTPEPSLPTPIAEGAGIRLTWPKSGQVFAYRVDRSRAGTGQWESLACLKPGAHDMVNSTRTTSTQLTEFRDESIALQPSTSYQYRITALGPADASGKRTTTESSVTATTAPRFVQVVAATAYPASTSGPRVTLSWQRAQATLVNSYLITSSFGFRSIIAGADVFSAGSPSGTHTFSVTPLYINGMPAATTTVTVVVP